MTAPWVQKARRLIGAMACAAWQKANRLPDGKLRKRHVPYRLPEDAERLVDCLRRNDEEGAKALFLNHAEYATEDAASLD